MVRCVNDCGAMLETTYQGVQIDVCPVCIGVWLDDHELGEIVRQQVTEWDPALVKKILEVTGDMGIPRPELDRSVGCPKCKEDMPPVNYLGNSGIIVNTCANNHGVWLDHGELVKIQVFVNRG